MADDESSSSDLGGDGAMGFFDVVAPTILAEAERSNSQKRSGPLSPTSAGAGDVVEVEDDSSGGETTDGAVGLFDAMDEGEAEAVVGAQLVDVGLLLGSKKGAPPPTPRMHGTCEMLAEGGPAVLGILNYGEDKFLTHEVDCIRVWDLASRKVLVRFPVQVRRIRRYNHWIFAVDTDSEDVLQIDLRDEDLKPNRFTGLEEEATAIAINNFAGFGVTLFAITRDSYTYAWRCPPVEASGHEVNIATRYKGHTENVTSLDLGDQYLYTSSTDKTVRVWSYEDGSCVRTLAGHTDWVFSVKVIDRLVYSGSRDETVRVWNDRGDCVSVIKLGAVAFGIELEVPYLYIRDANKRVCIFESTVKGGSNKQVGVAEGSAGNVRHMIVYKNVLITCAEGAHVVRLWSAEDGRALAILKAHTDAVNGIALFGQGVVLSASEDGSVRKWDLKEVFAGALATNASPATAPTREGRSGSLFLAKFKSRSSDDGSGPSTTARRSSSLSDATSTLRSRRATNAPAADAAPSPKNRLLRSLTSSRLSTAPSANLPPITPSLIVQVQQSMKPLCKTHKLKGQFYPSTFTCKDLLAWLRVSFENMDSKSALEFAAALAREGAFELVLGSKLADKSSVILKLK